MTARILRSAIAGIHDFEAQAATHAVEMREWRAHQERVSADEAAGVIGIERHWPLKRPTAHPAVEAAVNEKSEMDFDLIEDGPTADDLLRLKKEALSQIVHQAEHAAISSIVPLGKQRFRDIRRQEIEAADIERAAEDGGLLKMAATAIGLRGRRDRTQAETDFLEQHQDEQSRIRAIQRAAAEAQHDIEDLTSETVDAWSVPDLSAF